MENERDELDALGDMSDLDEQILARAGEDDLSDQMMEKKDKATAERDPWVKELAAHWFSYVLLGLSFLLTEMTAWYLGTAPTLRTNPDGSSYIEFHTDMGHLATTLVYMLVFPIVTEVAFAYFRRKFDDRESGNRPQQISAMSGALLGLVSIIGTGVSGAFVIFSTLGSVGFLEVPPSVQTWLIWIIPILLAFFGLLNWIYGSNSREAKAQKMAEEDDRKAELNDSIRIREIKRSGKRAIIAESIRVYRDLVSRGILSSREASDGLAEGLSLEELEKKLKRDLTGEGRIGDASGYRKPIPILPSSPAPIPPRASRWTLRALLSYIGMDAAQARETLRDNRLFDARSAYQALAGSGYIPESLSVEDFMPLFCELAGVASPTWDSIPLAFNPGIIPPGFPKDKQESPRGF